MKSPRRKSKKQASKTAPRNRYHLHAKLTEYRFLQILKGFAHNLSPHELAESHRVSEKTIRSTYRALRGRLYDAVLARPKEFGGAGFFLFRNGQLTNRGRAFLQSVAESEIFVGHLKRHAPRVETKKEARDLLFEATVRVFCNVAMGKDQETLYPEQTRQALADIREIADWIRENRTRPGFLTEYADFIQRFGKVVDAMPGLLEQEELLSLRDKSTAHRYPEQILYDDLRRFLLAHPISS